MHSSNLASPATAARYEENWVAEGGASETIIGSLNIVLDGDDAVITFQTGKSLRMKRVDGVAGLYKVIEPEDPILRRGTRLCGEKVTYIGSIAGGDNERWLKVFTGSQPSAAQLTFYPGGGSCAVYPMFSQ